MPATSSVPVIFFQGRTGRRGRTPADPRHGQRAGDQGILAEGHYYPDERHGFRKAGNQAHALEQEWLFYRRVIELTS
jgi:hypothetical protein